MEKKAFTELGLSPEILKAVSAMGFEEASPIQSEAIPALMSGADVVGQSQTGSGKTAAFAIPAIERIDPALAATQVLILCPTRELALQVAEETAKLAAYKKGVRELPIYGGQSYDRQFRGLKQGAHLVIGTPGRILDHLQKGTLKLGDLRTIILDEADRMLDMGFLDDIRAILDKMPESRQTVLFSATVPKPIAELVKTFTRDPVWVKIKSPEMTVPEIDQVWYEVNRRTKLDALCRIIDMDDVRYGIIFCATKVMVDELVEHLNARGYQADKLHGDMTQNMRERVMNRFRRRAIEFLVATDVAARGLDVKDIEIVFNYDLPNDGEDYVHRIGRTGRAGRGGRAVTFVAGRELYRLQNIMRFTKGKIRRERIPTLEQIEERKANVFFDNLRSLLESGDFPRRDDLTDRLLDQGHSPTDIISALIHLRESESPKAAPASEETPPAKKYDLNTYEEKRPRKEHKSAKADSSRSDKPFQETRRGRRTESLDMQALVLNVGREHGIRPGDVFGVVVGATKVPKGAVGAIDVQAEETRVDIDRKFASKVAQKLQGILFKDYSLSTYLEG